MAKLVVVPVHGVSDHVLKPGYANDFFRMLVERLMHLGVIPEGASEKEIAEYIVSEPVNYSQYGQDAEDLVYNTYLEAQSALFKPWDKVLNAVFIENIRHLLITAASDVFVYQNESCRELIRGEVRKSIKPYVKTGDAVSVVGHSLGGVVAFDTIYYEATQPEWSKAKFLPSNLFTMGAPILLFSLDLLDECGNPEQKARFDPNKFLDQKLIRTDGAWLNFLDPQDIIGYPLEIYFRKKHKVQDIIVGTGMLPTTAHSGYWHNHEVVNNIADRLLLDYERINATAPPAQLASSPQSGKPGK